MDLGELGLTALRASVIYVFLLIVLRLLGKRSVGHATAFDFMVALILGEIVDEPIYGDVPMTKALLAIVVVAGWHFVNSWLSTRSTWFDRLTGGMPRVLVENGVIDRAAMSKEHVNDDELWTMLRRHEIERMEEVKVATLEPSGELSVIKTDAARELRKGDLAPLLHDAA
jgi:uncharacterized membrane protein YcaP (DUF421 family)